MKSNQIAITWLCIAIFVSGAAACKSSPTPESARQPSSESSNETPNSNSNPSSDEGIANSSGSENNASTAENEVAATTNANTTTESNPQHKGVVRTGSSRGATRVQMRNVDFHSEDPIVLRIRELQGALLRKNKSNPPVFDNKRSFILRIDSGTVGIRTDSLTYLMNNYVFNYPKAPLKHLKLETKGDKLKMSGRLHKGIVVPFSIVGSLAPTPEGKIQIHPSSIKAAGLPVKGLMKLFGIELAELLKTSQARGITINENDIIMDPELILPPPTIQGRISAVRIEGNEVVQDFGGKPSRGSKPGSNYMYFRGGTLRFGKLTMNDADLRIIDASPKDTFDFSLDHYNSQLVAGHSRNTSNFGLVVVMPDYNKLHQASRAAGGKTSGGELSRR